MRTNKLTLMKPVIAVNIDADLIEDKILPLNKAGKLNVIKCMFTNLRTLAQALSYSRCDITKAINAILLGDSIDLNRLSVRYVMGLITKEQCAGWRDGIFTRVGAREVDRSGHILITADLATGDMTLCGHSTENLRADDMDVIDRVPHNMPVDYNDYSEPQLLTIINHLFMNIRALATALEGVRSDVTAVLDAIAENYDNHSVEMTIADIGFKALFTRPYEFIATQPYLVLDHRNNHFYLYELTRDVSDRNPLPDDHLNLVDDGYTIPVGSTPAVRPNQKMIDKCKKNPHNNVVRGD